MQHCSQAPLSALCGPDSQCSLIWPSWTPQPASHFPCSDPWESPLRTHYQLQVMEVRSSTKHWEPASYTIGHRELYILYILPLWASLAVGSHLATGNMLHGHLVSTELRVWAQLLPITSTVRLCLFPESKQNSHHHEEEGTHSSPAWQLHPL